MQQWNSLPQDAADDKWARKAIGHIQERKPVTKMPSVAPQAFLSHTIICVAFRCVLMKATQVSRLGHCSACYLGMKLQASKSFFLYRITRAHLLADTSH